MLTTRMTHPNVTAGRPGPAALVILLSALFVAGCGGPGAEEKTESGPVPVYVATVETETVVPTLEFSGSVAPWREASIGAVMSGQVSRIHVEPGDRVAKDDVLIEMAAEQLTQAEAQYVAMEKDWERTKRLLEKGSATQQAFDQIDAAYQAAKATYELVLESTLIRAPFGGVVSATYLEEGEVFVLMPGGAASSPALVEVVRMDTVKVSIEVPERELSEVKKGLRAEIRIDAYPKRTFDGVVRLVEPALSTRTRTATAEVLIPNPGEELRPGMFAHVTVELTPREAVLVPHDGVVQKEGTGSYDAMVVENGTASRVSVELGRTYGDHHEVISGLEPGQTVITTGRYRLPDGAAVLVKTEEDGR